MSPRRLPSSSRISVMTAEKIARALGGRRSNSAWAAQCSTHLLRVHELGPLEIFVARAEARALLYATGESHAARSGRRACRPSPSATTSPPRWGLDEVQHVMAE